MEAGPGEEGPEGLTQCSNHPARSPAVGGVPAQALWGSQRIPSPCHKLPWAGTPAHSNRSVATGGLHRSLHSHTLPPSPHSHPLFLTHSHSPSYSRTLPHTCLHTHTLTPSLLHRHPHAHTHSCTHPLRKPERKQYLLCLPSPHPHAPVIEAISICLRPPTTCKRPERKPAVRMRPVNPNTWSWAAEGRDKRICSGIPAGHRRKRDSF